MLDYSAIWNEICFHVNKSRYANEQDFQTTIEFMFEKLGWSLYKGEIVSQISIPVGSSGSVRPDIVIKDTGKIVLVIELKRANASITERNADQLKSYMRLLRLDYGILLGETLRIYWDLPTSNDSADKVCDIRFEADSSIGVECVKVLCKDSFSLDRVNEFCKKCLSDPARYIEEFKVAPQYESTTRNSIEKDRDKNLNFISRSSIYGKEFRGRQILDFLSEQGNEHLYIGKQNIESKILKMTKIDIENTKFWLNDKPSSKGSSWITGKRFVMLYEKAK